LTGVILAGGENRRMNGKMKSFLPFGEQSLLERQLSRMKTVCEQSLIVTRQPSLFSHIKADDGIDILTDERGAGPLAGIEAAFSHVKTGDLWVVACDMPYISPEAARMLHRIRKQGDWDAAIPVIRGRIQPLHGIY